MLHGLIQQESGFDPSSQSSAGASGLTQLMPATASSLGVANPLNPAESIEGGARYLSQLMSQFAGNTTDALAAYNAGPGAVTAVRRGASLCGNPELRLQSPRLCRSVPPGSSLGKRRGARVNAMPVMPAPSRAAPPGSGPAPPGGPPGAPPFESALAEHWARTANAEGRKREGAEARREDSSGGHRNEHVADAAPVGGAVATAHPSESSVADATASAGSAAVDGQGAPAAPQGAGAQGSAVASTSTLVATGQGVVLPPGTSSQVPESPSFPAGNDPVQGSPPGESPTPGPGPATPLPASEGHAPGPAAPQGAATSVQGTVPVVGKAQGAQGSAASSSALANPSTITAPTASPQAGAAQSTPEATVGATTPTVPTGNAATQQVAPTSNAAPQPAPPAPPGSGPNAGAQPAGVASQTAVPQSRERLNSPVSSSLAPGTSPAGKLPAAAGPDSRASQGRSDARSGRQALLAIPPTAGANGSASSAAGNGASPIAASGSSAASTIAAAAEPSAVLSSGVGMQDMIDAIRATVDLAVRQGLTQAKIALQPAELGEIRIHLSQSADGLIARVTADTPAAAQALAQGRSELHQSLSSLGLPLLRLDIGAQTGQHEGPAARDTGGSGSPATSTNTSKDDGSPETIGELESNSPTAGIASGGLVDVLA